MTVCRQQGGIILLGSQHSGEGTDGRALGDLLSGIDHQHAELVQPAEQGLGGGDTPRQCFGTARNFAFLFHPFEVAVEVFGGDLADGHIFGEEGGQQAHIRKEGFDRVGRAALIRQIGFPRTDGGRQRRIGC